MKNFLTSILGVLLATGLAVAASPDGKDKDKGGIEPGSIGLAEIDPTQVQVRVGGTCSVGSFIAAIGVDGSVTCESGTDSNQNTLYGRSALASNTSGIWNTATGLQALFSNTTGRGNSAFGVNALLSNTTGNENTAAGINALRNNGTGTENTATGREALYYNTVGYQNTANGNQALFSNIGGIYNTAVGDRALYSSTDNNNTAVGTFALRYNTTGGQNTAVGYQAGVNNITGDHNIAIGFNVIGEAEENFTTRIGMNQRRTFISGIRGFTTGNSDTVSVVIDSAGQLGTVSSSRRFKEDIQDMGNTSDRLLQLRPVTFRYKEAYENGEKPLDYGLIAEEVAEVFPELVVYNEKRQPDTVKYRLLSSMLLNELQKEHQMNEQQAVQLASITDQYAEISELKAQVAELNQLVQQMAKLALPATELVANNTGD